MEMTCIWMFKREAQAYEWKLRHFHVCPWDKSYRCNFRVIGLVLIQMTGKRTCRYEVELFLIKIIMEEELEYWWTIRTCLNSVYESCKASLWQSHRFHDFNFCSLSDLNRNNEMENVRRLFQNVQSWSICSKNSLVFVPGIFHNISFSCCYFTFLGYFVKH